MRILPSLLLILITFYSCSTSSDSTTDEQDNTQMDNNMMMEVGGSMIENAAYSGDFVSSAHPTSGTATVNEDKTLLHFTNFKTDNGPVLEVYLATNTSATTYISLGVLKGIEGDYEYALPDGVDYTAYDHVIIWCVDFKVNFGYAVLK